MSCIAHWSTVVCDHEHNAWLVQCLIWQKSKVFRVVYFADNVSACSTGALCKVYVVFIKVVMLVKYNLQWSTISMVVTPIRKMYSVCFNLQLRKCIHRSSRHANVYTNRRRRRACIKNYLHSWSLAYKETRNDIFRSPAVTPRSTLLLSSSKSSEWWQSASERVSSSALPKCGSPCTGHWFEHITDVFHWCVEFSVNRVYQKLV